MKCGFYSILPQSSFFFTLYNNQVFCFIWCICLYEFVWLHAYLRPDSMCGIYTHVYGCVLVKVLAAVRKHHDQVQLWERFISVHSSQITIHYQGESEQKLKTRTWRQKLKQKLWGITAYWLASHDLLTLPSYTTQDRLFSGSITNSGLGLLTPITNQENTLKICL